MVSLVLLGAGASYGSKEVVPYAPPLGNGPMGLFARLEEQFALASNLPEALKQKFRDNFEHGMAEYYEYADGNIMAFQRNLAAYLAQFTPGPSNEYRKLIQKLGIKRVVYSTLNYDLLFEQSAADIGLNTQYSLVEQPQCVRLLKLHGSCNFWPDIPMGMFTGLTVSRNGRADVSARVLPLDQQQTLRRCREDDSFAPAIAMYAEGKSVKVCPDYVDAQQHQWNSTALKARHILISGVRVHPSDIHIWDVLAKSSANVTYFGLNLDKDEFLEWKERASKKNAYFIEADFSTSIKFMESRLS